MSLRTATTQQKTWQNTETTKTNEEHQRTAREKHVKTKKSQTIKHEETY